MYSVAKLENVKKGIIFKYDIFKLGFISTYYGLNTV